MDYCYMNKQVGETSVSCTLPHSILTDFVCINLYVYFQLDFSLLSALGILLCLQSQHGQLIKELIHHKLEVWGKRK